MRTVDSYRFLNRVTAKVIRAWVQREQPGVIPWSPPRTPLSACTVALVSSAGIARTEDRPFDQEGERRDPWWGDPSFRVIPRDTTEADVRLHHLHVDTRLGAQDLDCVLPLRRLEELRAGGVVGGVAASHYSVMGFLLHPAELVETTAPAIARSMVAEGVDAAVLVPV